MIEKTYGYATYHQDRDSFVVEDAGWEDDCPVIEYRFVYFIDPNTCRKLGGIDKRYLEYGYLVNDIYVFKTYRSKPKFQADIKMMMANALQRSQATGRDYFLCVLDLVKLRAVRSKREYPYILDYDELFDIGPLDAYHWRVHE